MCGLIALRELILSFYGNYCTIKCLTVSRSQTVLKIPQIRQRVIGVNHTPTQRLAIYQKVLKAGSSSLGDITE